MLATLIQRYDKKSFLFLSSSKNESLNEILQAVTCHMLWSYNTTCIYQFIKPFLDKKKKNVCFGEIWSL